MDSIVTKECANVPAKTYLKAHFNIPHFTILKLIKAQKITLNQKLIQKEDIVKEGDVLTIPEEFGQHLKKETIQPQNHTVPIIFENEDFLVIAKPKNMSVNEESTLTEHLAWLSKEQKSEWRYKPCHRLDKDTAGVLLIAKNLRTLSDLQTKFQNKEITKIYEATCIGIPKEKEATLTFKLAREGHKTIVSEEGKEKITIYNIVESFVQQDITLTKVDIQLITGFTHQIRVHFQHMSHPLLGDDVYGNQEINEKLQIHTQELIAKKIAFEYKSKEYCITI